MADNPPKRKVNARKDKGKRRNAASPSFPEIPRDSPPIPQRYSQHLPGGWYGRLIPPRDVTLRLLARWRFPDDPARRAVFVEHPPTPLTIRDELAHLIVCQQKLARLDTIEKSCDEILRLGDADPRHAIAIELTQRVAAARAALRTRGDADLGRIEFLCSRTNAMVLIPLARRGQKYAPGRRRDAVDALSRVILEVLAEDPRMAQKDIKRRLEDRQGRGVVVRLFRDPRRSGVVWKTSDGREKRTTWAAILDSRVPRLRKLVKRVSAI